MSRKRRGYTLVMVLFCLTVLMIAVTSVSRSILRTRESVRHHHLQSQADWLAQSGVSRALNRIATNPAYSGETWQVDVPTTHIAAKVEIQVGQDANTNVYTVQAIGTYPSDTDVPTTSRQQIKVSRAKFKGENTDE